MIYRHFLSFLTLLFGGALIYNILFCVFNVTMNIAWPSIPDDVKRPRTHPPSLFVRAATIYERDGYEIPVKLNIAFADSIVQIAGELNDETKIKEDWIQENGPYNNRKWQSSWSISLSKWTNSRVPTFDIIYATDTLITRALVTKTPYAVMRKAVEEKDSKVLGCYGINIDARSKENIFELLRLQPFIKTHVNIKSKTRYQHVLLFLRVNLKLLFHIFIFFQLFKSVLALKYNFKVNSEFYNRIKWIGWTIIMYVVLQCLMDYMVGRLYDFISIQSDSTAINYMESVKIFMHGYADFSFEAFVSGLLLITFSLLMKGALETEKNWALTI